MTLPPLPLSIAALYVGAPTRIQQGKKAVTSGIDKRPAPSLEVRAGGVAGDCVANEKYHGGPDQAVYLYTNADAEAWAAVGLHAGVERAYFGENVRLAAGGLRSAEVRVGDRFHFGSGGGGGVVLEATAPRLPCAVAAAYVTAVSSYTGPFVRDMYALEACGIYARVIRAGRLEGGAAGEYQPTTQVDAPTLLELMQLHKGQFDADMLGRALASPLSARMRAEVEEKAARLELHVNPHSKL